MITDVISINTEEYKELVAKATKYDQLRKAAERANYLTDFERAVYEISDTVVINDKLGIVP